jgi:hypothetical protein
MMRFLQGEKSIQGYCAARGPSSAWNAVKPREIAGVRNDIKSFAPFN